MNSFVFFILFQALVSYNWEAPLFSYGEDFYADSFEDEDKIKVIKQYYSYTKEEDLDKRYALLSSESKKNLPFETYKEIVMLDNEIDHVFSMEFVEKTNENTFLIDQEVERYYLDGEYEITPIEMELVKEDGVWKYNYKDERLASDWNLRLIENNLLLYVMCKEGIWYEKDEEIAKEHYDAAMKRLEGRNTKDYMLGMTYYLVSDYETSYFYFEDFVKTNQNKELQKHAYSYLLDISYLLDDSESVILYANKLLDYDPENEFAQRMLEESYY